MSNRELVWRGLFSLLLIGMLFGTVLWRAHVDGKAAMLRQQSVGFGQTEGVAR